MTRISNGLRRRARSSTRAALALALGCVALAAAAQDGPLRLEREDGQLLYYAGQVRLSGRYEWRLQDPWPELTGNSVCFEADAPSARRVPRRPGDARGPFFCFSNSDAARRLFKLKAAAPGAVCGYAGKAEIVVGEYVANTAISDVLDFAALRKVVRADAPRPLAACD